VQLVRGVVLALVGHAVAVLRRRPGRGSWADAVSHGLVDSFEHLGPTWVKVGQIVASSPGLFPATLADACQRTLDEVPPFDGSTARGVVAEDLGRDVSELFLSFDDTPLSAASVGQVHACVLPDGREAVVKLQRPGIRELFTVDFRIMYRTARFLQRFKRLQSVRPVAVVEDAHRVAFSELNPALEAFNQDGFRSRIWAFGDNKWITAPEVHWGWCGPRVICMERLSGVSMDEFDELDRRGVDGELVLRRGAKVWIEAVCLHGPFHGDMHAGNIWVLDDGRGCFLDFGIMGELPQLYREVVMDILFTTMIDHDFTRIARAYRRVGVFPADIGTDEELGERMAMIIGPMLDAGMSGLNLMDNYEASAPTEMMLIVKQLAYIERYAKQLAPDYVLIGDLFLISNIFPEAVAEQVEARGIQLPD
jgi:predicted unusual protein kinase regulating ubiquinone biosynthesis (AarF/ABC1/UbiB family)